MLESKHFNPIYRRGWPGLCLKGGGGTINGEGLLVGTCALKHLVAFCGGCHRPVCGFLLGGICGEGSVWGARLRVGRG